jgi:hypothetical protein
LHFKALLSFAEFLSNMIQFQRLASEFGTHTQIVSVKRLFLGCASGFKGQAFLLGSPSFGL